MDVEQTHTKLKKYRGKLYGLSAESAWEDTGTGHASITGTGESRRLVFRDEESGEVIHDRPVFPPDTYQLQGEGFRQSIIVWEDPGPDPEHQKDWALSFQDPDGTQEIWEAIAGEQSTDDKRLLPLPKLGNLMELCRLLTCVAPSQREPLAVECMTPRFLNALREAFHTAEDLNSEEALTHLWHITKGVFLLSNQKLTERFLKSDVYEDVLGMLEYDSGLPPDKRIPHRQVLKVKVQFQHVISFEDSETLDRIHLNYRLQYLKDIVLPRLLDDASFVSLTQMIHANISAILDHLQRSAQLLDTLFLQVRQRDLQSLLFLQDACRLAKQIPPPERQALYEKFVERKLFEVLVPFFSEDCAKGQSGTLRPCHLAVEVLLLSVGNDPSHLRCYLTAQGSAEGRALLSELIRVVLTEEDQGVQGQAAEVLKQVMDPTALENRERDSCLDVFYDRGALDELVAPLRPDAGKPVGPSACFGQQLICELLAFAVQHHSFRAKIYVMRHNLAQQAMRLMASPQRFLQLAPVRLLRSIVGTKDEAYHRYLTKNGLFTPIMRSFQQCLQPPALGGNLLISVTLEMLEFIRQSNLKILVHHICSKHSGLLQEHASKFKTLEGLLLKHQQNREYEAFPPEQHAAGGPISRGDGIGHPSRQRSPGRGEDSDDDEAYFESLDEEEDSLSANAPQAESVGDAAPGDSGARRARLLAAAGRVFGAGAAGAGGAGPAMLKAKEEEASTAAPSLKGLLGGYEDDDEEEGGRSGAAEVEACIGEEITTTGGSSDASVAAEEPAPLDTTGGPCGDTVGEAGDAATGGADGASAGDTPDATPTAPVEAEGPPPACPGSAEVASGEQVDAAPCPPATAEAGSVEAGGTEAGGADAEEAEEAEAKGCAAGGEKALNHVSKRLKTSASVQA